MTTLKTLSVNLIFGNKILPNPRMVMLDAAGNLYVSVKRGFKSCTVRDETSVFVDPKNYKEILKADLRKATNADFGIAETEAPKTEVVVPKKAKAVDTTEAMKAAFTSTLKPTKNYDASIRGFSVQLENALKADPVDQKRVARLQKSILTAQGNRTLSLLGS